MAMNLQVGGTTRLTALLSGNEFYDFRVHKIDSPNGWQITGTPKGASWLRRVFCKEYAYCGPPDVITTSSIVMAAALHSSLSVHGFEINLAW